jgi:iron complex transport system permease protein
VSPAPRKLATLALLALILATAVGLRLYAGSAGTELSPEAKAQILELRESRALMGCIVGAALAVAGVMLQSLLRNPLASPDLLGLASGAGLGVMLVAFIGWRAGWGIAGPGWPAAPAAGLSAAGPAPMGFAWTTSSAALIGALAALAIVFTLSQRRGLLDPVTLVLVGVVVSIMCSSGTLLLKSLLPDQGFAAGRLLLGELRDVGDVGRGQVWAAGIVTLLGVLVGVGAGKAMDAAALGEDEARSVGVPLGALRAVLFITAGVLCAGSVVLAGPIGFVGLICPHAVRLLAGPSHRTLIVGAALAGAALVVLADVLARLMDFGAGHPPIGVLTSLVGGPVLVILLRKGRT